MKIALVLCLWLSGLAATCWPASPPMAQVIASRSGQFVVRGLTGSLRTLSLTVTSAVDMVRMEPSVLAVSCEQVKQVLLSELHLKDQWRGRILLSLRLDSGPIRMVSHAYTDGWSYQLELPEQVDNELFDRALIEVLLCEIANRQPGPHPAQIPLWLTEGLAGHLRAITPGDLTLKPGSEFSRQTVKGDPLRNVRTCLQTNRPLNVTQLSWPSDEQLLEDRAAFRACSQLFLSRLLQLQDGRESLLQMLHYLPSYLNWQSAFLHAFKPHFSSLMALDKWWALQIVSFVGREEMFLWSGDETLAQLDEILRVQVQVRVRTADLPLYSDVSLQNVISEWAFGDQVTVLQQRINLLQALRLRALSRYAGLVDGYIAVLTQYVGKRKSNSESRALPSVAREALKQLYGLDLQRQAFPRTPPNPALAARRAEANK